MANSEIERKVPAIRRRKNPVALPEALQRRLHNYALAAGAAGVAALACSYPAEAEPVCRDLKAQLLSANTYPLNPANQKIAPFNVAQTTYAYSSISFGKFWSWNRGFFVPNSRGAEIVVDAKSYPVDVALGDSIGPKKKFGKGASYGLMFTYGKGLHGGRSDHGTLLKHRGNFNFQQINYVGFQFSDAGKVHYGWARLSVTFQETYGKHSILHVLASGYETIPDTGIAAGSCSASVSGNSATKTLGALALGVGGSSGSESGK